MVVDHWTLLRYYSRLRHPLPFPKMCPTAPEKVKRFQCVGQPLSSSCRAPSQVPRTMSERARKAPLSPLHLASTCPKPVLCSRVPLMLFRPNEIRRRDVDKHGQYARTSCTTGVSMDCAVLGTVGRDPGRASDCGRGSLDAFVCARQIPFLTFLFSSYGTGIFLKSIKVATCPQRRAPRFLRPSAPSATPSKRCVCLHAWQAWMVGGGQGERDQ